MKLSWQKGILYLAAAGVECSWFYALLSFLSKLTTNTISSITGILVLYPVAYIFNLLLHRLRMKKTIFLAISWVLWAAGMLLMMKLQLFADDPLFSTSWLLSLADSISASIYTFKAEVLIISSTAALWWLGQRLVFRELDHKAMLSTFQFGLVILVLTFVLASGLTLSLDNSIIIVLTFFLFALLGISIAYALEGVSWFSGIFRGQWSGILLIIVGFTIGLGILISIAITPDLLQILWKGINFVCSFIWSIILAILAFIASLLPAQEPSELPVMPEMPASTPEEEYVLWKLPEWLYNTLRISWSILVLGIIILALVRLSANIYEWFRRRLAHSGNAEVKPLKGALKEDILGLLKYLLARVRYLNLFSLLHRRVNALPVEVKTVRQIYRQLLHWAAKSGYPRQSAQTPYEYCYNLIAMLPQAGADLSLLTQQYVNARYGIWPAGESELENLKQAWTRLKRLKPKKEIARYIATKEVKAK